MTTAAKISPPIKRYLRKHIKAAHAILNPPLMEMSLALVADHRMSDLHQRFLNVPGPTDVLTFPLELDNKRRAIAGEVVVCVPEAKRRCKDHGGNVRQELLLYALHGLLHLCGFDDRTAWGFRRMHQLEDKILDQLGVGPVFSPKPNLPTRPLPRR